MALLHSRISRVFYVMPSRSSGALGSKWSIHCNSQFNHNFSVYRVRMPFLSLRQFADLDNMVVDAGIRLPNAKDCGQGDGKDNNAGNAVVKDSEEEVGKEKENDNQENQDTSCDASGQQEYKPEEEMKQENNRKEENEIEPEEKLVEQKEEEKVIEEKRLEQGAENGERSVGDQNIKEGVYQGEDMNQEIDVFADKATRIIPEEVYEKYYKSEDEEKDEGVAADIKKRYKQLRKQNKLESFSYACDALHTLYVERHVSYLNYGPVDEPHIKITTPLPTN